MLDTVLGGGTVTMNKTDRFSDAIAVILLGEMNNK